MSQDNFVAPLRLTSMLGWPITETTGPYRENPQLTDDPSSEPASFWGANYTAMRDVAQNIFAAENLGYSCMNNFVLPASCWWDEYYLPMQNRIESLREEAKHDQFLACAIKEANKEISLYREYGDQYGYVFYLLMKI